MANKITDFLRQVARQTREIVIDLIAPSAAPDRRDHVPVFVPLFQKTADNEVVYVGAFVPELLELYRAQERVNPLKDAIIRATKKYDVNANGEFVRETDLDNIAEKVGKSVRQTLREFRNSADPELANLNLFPVPRMQAVNLYCQNFKASAAEAGVGEFFISYSARNAAANLTTIKPTLREERLHMAGVWLGRLTALGAAITLGMVATPWVAVTAALATYYITSSASQFEFWDKAEMLIKNNWLLNKEYRSIHELDYMKTAKTLLVLGVILAMAYPVAMGTFASIVATPLIASVGLKIGLGALMAATASLGMVHGLMMVMHNWLALGFAKTNITDKELLAANLPAMVKADTDTFTADVKHYRNMSKAELMAELDRVSKLPAPRCAAKVVITDDVSKRYHRDITDCTAANMGGEAWIQAAESTKARIFNQFNPTDRVAVPVRRNLNLDFAAEEIHAGNDSATVPSTVLEKANTSVANK